MAPSFTSWTPAIWNRAFKNRAMPGPGIPGGTDDTRLGGAIFSRPTVHGFGWVALDWPVDQLSGSILTIQP